MSHSISAFLWAERWAAPEPGHLATCMRLEAACVVVPSGDRSAYSLGEGLLS